MHTKLQLNSRQKRVINKISARMAAAQAEYLKVEGDSLEEFAAVVGYISPKDARQYLIELLQGDDRAGSAAIFDDEADWSKTLSRIALKQIGDWANEDLASELEKLND